jgi:hypothetical protein
MLIPYSIQNGFIYLRPNIYCYHDNFKPANIHIDISISCLNFNAVHEGFQLPPHSPVNMQRLKAVTYPYMFYAYQSIHVHHVSIF